MKNELLKLGNKNIKYDLNITISNQINIDYNLNITTNAIDQD